MKKLFLFFILLSFVLFSCNKKDDISPYIQITSPNENSNHNVLDTIAVVGTISDNEQLEYVKISLLNENNITVGSVVTLFPETNEYSLNREFIIDDVTLEDGEYSLLVTVSDGENETRKYIDISLNEVPLELSGILFVEQTSSNAVTIKKMKPDLTGEQVAFVAGDFSSAATSSKNQAFYMAGSETGSLRAFSMLNNAEQWNIPANPLPGAPYFSDVFEDEGILYVSFFDGEIKAFDKNGTLKQHIVESGYKCYKIYRQGDLIFSEQVLTGTTNRRLVVYNALSGVAMQQTPLDMEIITFCKRNDDNVFVFGNSAGQGYMKNYVISDNGFWEPHALPAGEVWCAARVDDNSFLIGCEEGLKKYTYNPNSLTQFSNNSYPATQVVYDHVNDLVVLYESWFISFINYSNGTPAGMVGTQGDVVSLTLLYNK